MSVYANAWDERGIGSGCSLEGCTPDLTRDNDLGHESRWSCAAYLEDDACEICYTFEEPQDIVYLFIAFYDGDTRTRTFRATVHNDGDNAKRSYVFKSSGRTSNYEYFYVDTVETKFLCVEPVGLSSNEWISLLEVTIPRPLCVGSQSLYSFLEAEGVQ